MAESERPRSVGTGKGGPCAEWEFTGRREGRRSPGTRRPRVASPEAHGPPSPGVAGQAPGQARRPLTRGHLDLQMRTLLKLRLVLEDQPGVGFEQGEALLTPGETEVARVAAAFHPERRAERGPPLPAPRGLILTVDYIFMKTRSRVPHTSHL